jgi:hypothetical protein
MPHQMIGLFARGPLALHRTLSRQVDDRVRKRRLRHQHPDICGKRQVFEPACSPSRA